MFSPLLSGCSSGANSSSRSSDDSGGSDTSTQTISADGDQISIPRAVAGAYLTCASKATSNEGSITFDCDLQTSNHQRFRDVAPQASFKWSLSYGGREVVSKSAASLTDPSTGHDRSWLLDSAAYPDPKKFRPRAMVSIPGQADSEVVRAEIDAVVKPVEAPTPTPTVRGSYTGEHIAFIMGVNRMSPAAEFGAVAGGPYMALSDVCQIEAASSKYWETK